MLQTLSFLRKKRKHWKCIQTQSEIQTDLGGTLVEYWRVKCPGDKVSSLQTLSHNPPGSLWNPAKMQVKFINRKKKHLQIPDKKVQYYVQSHGLAVTNKNMPTNNPSTLSDMCFTPIFEWNLKPRTEKTIRSSASAGFKDDNVYHVWPWLDFLWTQISCQSQKMVRFLDRNVFNLYT